MVNNRENNPVERQNKITKISQQLEKQLKRIDSLKEKITNLNKHEEVVEKKSENLSKLMSEILNKLVSQDEHFTKMEKQLPILQDASKTLDDYITRRTERFNHFHRGRDGNCPGWHHFNHRRH